MLTLKGPLMSQMDMYRGLGIKACDGSYIDTRNSWPFAILYTATAESAAVLAESVRAECKRSWLNSSPGGLYKLST